MFEARPIQTKVKHIILEQYLKSWGGIITFGARKSIQSAMQRGYTAGLHFVYVDCFAGRGRYEGELEDKKQGNPLNPVYGSPIIGIQALDSLVENGRKAGVPIGVNTILIEGDKKNYDELKTSLDLAGYTTRIHETQNFHNLNDGEIALICADSTHMVGNLLAYTMASNYTYAFYLLDPFGPTGIPLHTVSQIIQQDRHDVLINMPYQDLKKKSGILNKQQLSPAEISLLQNYDDMFGSTNWRTIVRQWMELSQDSRQAEVLEMQLANHYGNVLQDIDTGLSVKSLPLRFPDKERTMFHLYLTTHNPTGSIQMNKIMLDAGYAEQHLRWQLQYLKLSQGGNQMSLFSPEEIAPKVDKSQRDFGSEIEDKITDAFTGKTITRKQIYQLLADELYTPGEINKALSELKKNRKVSFNGSPSSLTHDSRITIY